MKTQKFQVIESDYDFVKAIRIVKGDLTKMRRKFLESSVRRFNLEHGAPYGTSRSGSAYNCGCEHDCCGCLISERVELCHLRDRYNEPYTIFTYFASFNY